MSKSYSLEPPDDLSRAPGESLCAYYNRKLRAKGRFDVEWYQVPGGQLRLRDRVERQDGLGF